ncbi:MAG TPA: hypothetical protein VFW29_04805 [Solirubrobacteraceae bacterium]|nr:hypothetical protein [Solirubrobacteraceae bacterium]
MVLTRVDELQRRVWLVRRVRKPVHGLEPLGILHHPELTVTIADVEPLAKLLLHACSERAGAGAGN